MLIGTRSTCRMCDKPIEYVGPYWRHVEGNPRHPALPIDDPGGTPIEVASLGAVPEVRADLFQLGDFVLNSGARSAWKLECDSLTHGDVRALAKMIAMMVGRFGSVEGVPRGGLPLEHELRAHVDRLGGPHLIVDDVLTTGGSLERARTAYRVGKSATATTEVVGAVVFARGPCPSWVRAVFRMSESFWVKR